MLILNIYPKFDSYKLSENTSRVFTIIFFQSFIYQCKFFIYLPLREIIDDLAERRYLGRPDK